MKPWAMARKAARVPLRHGCPLLLLVAMVIVAAAGAAIVSVYRSHRAEEAARLELVVQLRSSQIHQWLDHHLAEARHTANGPPARLYGRWRQSRDEAVHGRLLDQLALLRETTGAARAFIAGNDGTVVSASGQPAPARDYARAVESVLRSGQPLITDPVHGAAGMVWVDFVAPIPGPDERGPQAALVLSFDGGRFLEPALAQWPLPASEGRMTLIHQDGRLLAGHAGGAPDEGTLTLARQVEGVPWLVLAEVPSRHVYAGARERAAGIVALAVMALVAAAVGLSLARQSERLQALKLLQGVADGSRDIIYVKDLQGRYVLFNQEACRVFGRRAQDVIGRDVRMLMPPETAATLAEEDSRVLATGEAQAADHEVATPDGPRNYHSIKAPLRDDDGRIVGTFGISRDITEQVQQRARLEQEVQCRTAELGRTNQALQSAVDDLQAFSYSVSHDLRAPLQAIAGFAQSVVETEAAKLSDNGRRRLDRIVHSAGRMDRMIEDILACSRAERAQLQRQPVDLHALVREVGEELAPQYPATRLRVEALPPVQGDPVLLRQAIGNLLGNAFKFSAAAPAPEVVVEAAHEADAVQVRVRDNGPGFDPAYGHKLFQLFQRLHKESEFPGTGVGLAIVKRVIARHGGRVAAECVPGGWTTFSFTLPQGA